VFIRSGEKPMRRLLALAFLGITTFAGAQTAPTAKPSKTGILLLAHGGSAQSWNEEVRHIADVADLSTPTEVALGMSTRSAMAAGIQRLTARGVTQIVAVPLFVSSHSSVIDSTAYLLGQRPAEPEDLKMFASMDHGDGAMHMGAADMAAMDHSSMAGMNHDGATPAIPVARTPIPMKVPLRMAPALDSHHIVAEILVDRAASISKDPAHEVVILVAHGPVPDDENKIWLDTMARLGTQMQPKAHYAGIQYLTLRDDAGDTVRDAATAELRAHVEAITKAGNRALIVPLLLSYGGIEDGLRKRLDGMNYAITNQGILPDKRIATWVLESANVTPAP
jgi:sirohydrochlorin ferrochelatase